VKVFSCVIRGGCEKLSGSEDEEEALEGIFCGALSGAGIDTRLDYVLVQPTSGRPDKELYRSK
jgi:hypothetical protein